MFKVALGHTDDPDTEDAVLDIIAQCRLSLGDVQPQAGIVFSDIFYEYPVILQQIQSAFPQLQLIGCTSCGELSSTLGYADGSLVLMVFASDTISMATTIARNMSHGIKESVATAVDDLKSKLTGELTLGLVFPDIFTTGIVSLVNELQTSLGKNIPLFGGGASDPNKYDQTHEFYNQEVLQDAAPMLFFSGPLEYEFNVGSGWEPFTTQKQLMLCNKNVVHQIGDESALDFYKHYLSGAPTSSHPLAVFEPGQQRFYLRVPLSTEEESGSITFGGDLPQEATISICQTDPVKLIAEAHNLITKMPLSSTKTKPACALIFSCACRQQILGTKTKQEYLAFQDELPKDLPLLGFYAYGQVSPFEKNAPAFIHNDSIVALLLNEKNDLGK